MLTTAEIQRLVRLTTMNESDILYNYDLLKKRFPSGFLTFDQFKFLFQEIEIYGNKTRVYPSKILFDLTDRNRSGTIELNEYMLTMGLLVSRDVDFMVKYLFKLCDSDEDGLIDQKDIVDVLLTFSQISTDNDDDSERPNILNDVKSMIGEKIRICESDFQRFYAVNRRIQDIAGRLQTLLLFSMMVDYDFESTFV